MPTQTGFKKDIQGSWILKDPGAYLTYTIDWSDWLSLGANLSTSTWTIETIPGDTTPITNEGTSIIDNQAVIQLQGGKAGEMYTITNTVTTDDGLTDVRRFRIKVEQRYL